MQTGIPEPIAWAGIVAAVMLLYVIWKRRQLYQHRLFYLFRGAFIGVVIYFLFQLSDQLRPHALIVGAFAWFVIYAYRPDRRRTIPTHVKRQVVRKWEYKTGKTYDPRSYELDHKIPFSKGGSHTADNLQVVEKVRNRAKSARSPWWDVLGR